MNRFVVIGAGIVGLAVARQLLLDNPQATVTVLEKEDGAGRHQTGHNSGVIHAGVYYAPGSLKAKLCKAGAASMVDFCDKHSIPYQITGKLIVATADEQLGRLRALRDRALANGLPVRLITGHEAREFEPHVSCVAALHVASTGIVDFGRVARVLADEVRGLGGDVRFGAKVIGIAAGAVQTTAGDVAFDTLINCAGLYADRIAALAGARPPARIVPFRGEYANLRPEKSGLVKGLIYPVPDPKFPFLGVHLTKMIDGSVHAGPNAVLALAREGYSWRDVNLREFAGTVAYSGMRRLAVRNLRYGISEMTRSLSPKRFAASVAELMPQITEADLVAGGAGVRAQAIRPDGSLVDDFLIVRAFNQIHVLNAPSPAATSSLEIAKHITGLLN